LTADIQAYYGIIFMPSFIINLMSEFTFKPLLTTLTEIWLIKRNRDFFNKIMHLLKWIVFLTAIALIGGYFFGIPILSLIYGVDLLPLKKELMLLLLGGGFSAISLLLNNLLTIIRKQAGLLFGYVIASLFTSVISPMFVRNMGISGASYAYLYSTILLCILFTGMLFCFSKARKRKDILEGKGNLC
jgi:O-antigen/teichoic acid export membrane protein